MIVFNVPPLLSRSVSDHASAVVTVWPETELGASLVLITDALPNAGLLICLKAI